MDDPVNGLDNGGLAKGLWELLRLRA